MNEQCENYELPPFRMKLLLDAEYKIGEITMIMNSKLLPPEVILREIKEILNG